MRLYVPILCLCLAVSHDAFAESGEAAYAANREAVALLDQGRFDEALAVSQRALDLAEKTLGPDHPGLAAALVNQGELYAQMGRYDLAEPPMRRAIGSAQDSWGVGPLDLGKMLNDLGKLHALQGRYDDAETYYRRALAQEPAIGRSDAAPLVWRNNLAILYSRAGRTREAWQVLEQGLERLKGKQESNPTLADSFALIGRLRFDEGDYAAAQQATENALAIRRSVLGERHPATAQALHDLAIVLDRRGMTDDAERLLLQSLQLVQSLPADNPQFGDTLMDIGDFYARHGKAALAQRHFVRAFDSLRARLRQYFGFMSEADRLAFLATVEADFPAYYRFCTRMAAAQPDCVGMMFDLVLMQKGMVAVSMRSLAAQLGRGTSAAAAAGAQRLASLRALIASRGRSGGDAALEPLRQQAEELERQLARQSADFARRQQAADLRWTSVRDALAPDEAAVEYVVFDVHSEKASAPARAWVALVLRAGDAAPALVTLGDGAAEAQAMADYRRQAGLARGQEAEPGKSFREVFWQALLPRLANAKRVHVAPDGVLNQVAWPVLHDAQDTLLVETIDLRLLSSTRDLVGARAPSKARTAVLFGNPDFGGSASAASFAPLPGTEGEVKAIASQLREAGWQVEDYEGAAASEARVKAVAHPRVLHVATHGFFDPPARAAAGVADPMLRSGLALAGANLAGHDAAQREDGILTALEAASLDLRGTELVVLSACESGLGEQRTGEGVFGLRRAFDEAGADAVLMSLWRVPDQDARELMTSFYRNWLGGMDKHLALRTAQRALRERVIQDWGRDRPKLWGAFVLVGR